MNKLVKLILILRYPPFLKALVYRNIAAGVEHFGLFEYLSGGSINTIVDIGANRGQFVLVARKYFPSAKIYSFEPLIKPAGSFYVCLPMIKELFCMRLLLGRMLQTCLFMFLVRTTDFRCYRLLLCKINYSLEPWMLKLVTSR